MTSRAQLGGSNSDHPSHLPVFNHVSTHYSSPLTAQDQEHRQRREHLTSGGMLVPNTNITGVVEATGSVIDRGDMHKKQQQHEASVGFSTSFSASSVAAGESSDSYMSNIDQWARGSGSSDGAWQRGLEHDVDVSIDNRSSGGSFSPSERRCAMEPQWNNTLADIDRSVSSRESFDYGLWDTVDCGASALPWSSSLAHRRNEGSTWGS